MFNDYPLDIQAELYRKKRIEEEARRQLLREVNAKPLLAPALTWAGQKLTALGIRMQKRYEARQKKLQERIEPANMTTHIARG